MFQVEDNAREILCARCETQTLVKLFTKIVVISGRVFFILYKRAGSHCRLYPAQRDPETSRNVLQKKREKKLKSVVISVLKDAWTTRSTRSERV